ncbi:GH1 family beta-glucosidase [Micromonospora endophytica]|uniref:Beta-glucosidase n=1 Tax=Micromonospora endophytica TaxID=515350 RepID=A0A2W2CER8_9ACTN|nr:GH1 family beta-glucosidase [Micromonospora endophytica]PZF97831.1 beta-glucosidase [Micromonospora endophytica]RIW43243.1 beta-glucosidase [Micromonospora endophytica]BCJ61524.1 beta-glucosidase [Micromonospora endophytica]
MSMLTRRHLLRRAALSAAAQAGPARAAAGTTATAASTTALAGCRSDDRTDPAVAPATRLPFPPDFGWGAATSAYQIEGAAKEDGRGESIWDTFSHTPGRIRNGDTGDVAADHYHRYAEDLDLMRDLGLRSYRFSISWPRIQPDGTGAANQRGLDFYRRLVDGLHERGIAPMATLFHWDLPQSLQDVGGWESRDVAHRFADYADILFAALGDRVPVWLTINEPKTVVQNGYLQGHHAPGQQDPDAAYLVAHHLQLAHGLAVRALRAGGVESRIGPAFNLHPCYPADDSPGAAEAARLYDGYENRLYLDSTFHGSYPEDVLADLGPSSRMVRGIHDGDLEIISSPVDLLAVQYYTPIYVTADGGTARRWPTSEASWQQIYPDGMYDILTRVTRDYGPVPLTVTENGLPTPDVLAADGTVEDTARVTFLRDHLAAAHRAVTDGVPLESFHVWSLLDNFEWAEGYDQRWGLIYVDYPTQRRVLKRSAHWYRQVITDNAL